MKNRGWIVMASLWIWLSLGFVLFGQQTPPATAEKEIHQFQIDREIKRTSIKNQARTGTCWSYAAISFLESELLRLGRGEFDLSEMYVARQAYVRKAWHFFRLHGEAPFGEGGQSHDVLDTMAANGIVPESVYPGILYEENRHNHGELSAILKGLLEAVVKRPGGKVTPRWIDAFAALLDVYLGKVPESFEYKGKKYSPTGFFKEVIGLNPSDYVELTSFGAYPFYRKCRLEIPDNWSMNGDYYNVSLDDLQAAVDHALNNGFSVCWDGDISEKGFYFKMGYGVVPFTDWEDLSQGERDSKPIEPEKEKEVDQTMRDRLFDNLTTTDDHLMHLVGLAHDQKGTRFYYTKNSHSEDRKYNGYLFMSRSYLRLKTIAVMMHKSALPPALRQKLGI